MHRGNSACDGPPSHSALQNSDRNQAVVPRHGTPGAIRISGSVSDPRQSACCTSLLLHVLRWRPWWTRGWKPWRRLGSQAWRSSAPGSEASEAAAGGPAGAAGAARCDPGPGPAAAAPPQQLRRRCRRGAGGAPGPDGDGGSLGPHGRMGACTVGAVGGTVGRCCRKGSACARWPVATGRGCPAGNPGVSRRSRSKLRSGAAAVVVQAPWLLAHAVVWVPP